MRRLGIVLLILALSCAAFGQGTTSRIMGTVSDRTGAVIAGANVTATNEGTNVSFKTTSSGTGAYVFDSLQVGKYTITAEFQGFKKFVSTGNVLEIGAPIAVNVTLDVGATGDVVEVQGGYELVQTETSGNFGSVVDTKTLHDMPIVGTRGRNPLSLTSMIPGVQSAGSSAGGESSVHGARDRSWNYTLDGVDSNETSYGGAELSPTRVNPDSLAEFKVITSNPTSEYGRNTGAQVTMVTKSGTNQFHGTAFWFYQSPFLMANGATNKATQYLAWLADPKKVKNQRPQFVQNIPGFAVGGPIFKNKTFFFVNLQLLHAKNTSQMNQTVYTESARKGLWRYVTSGRNTAYGASGASVDANGNPVVAFATYDMTANDPQKIGLDTAISKYLSTYYPLPNTFTYGDGLNMAGYTFRATQLEKQVDLTVKIDHTFNARHSIFGRWAGGHQNTYGDTVNAGQPAFPGLPNFVDTTRQPRNLAINWRWVPTAKTTNELVLGMNRFIFDFPNPDPNARTNPPYNFTNITSQALQSYISNGRALTTMQLVDNFTLAQGAHTWKWGVNFRYARHIDRRGSVGSLNALLNLNFSQSTAPVNLTDYKIPTNINTTYDRGPMLQGINELLGRIGAVQQGFVAKDLNTWFPGGTILHNDQRWGEYDFYFQDSWKLRPNLVIDYGLRLDARLSPRLENFPNLVPDQSVLFGLTPSTTLKWVKGQQFNDDWNNFGPSLGIAWDPFKDGKTSIRANFRTAYDRINTFSFSSGIYQGLPGLTYQLTDTAHAGQRISAGIPTLAPSTTPSALTQPPTFSTNSITVADPNMHTPKTHMWGLSIQRQVSKNSAVTLTYNGRHGVGLYGGYDANAVNMSSNGFLNAFNVVKAGGQSTLFDQLFKADTRCAGKTGADCARANYASNFTLNSAAALAQSISQRTQSGVPLLQADGLPLTFFQAYPQFTGALNVLSTRDYSNYNGLEAQFDRRFANGLLMQASWTWSKSLDVRSYDPTSTRVQRGLAQSASATPFSIFNPRLNYGPSDFDHTHVINFNWVYELPFGAGKHWGGGWNRAVDNLLGGWEIAGFASYQTGRPFTIFSGSYTMSNVIETPASCSGGNGCDPYAPNRYFDSTVGQYLMYTPTQKGQFTQPAPGAFSNIGRNSARFLPYANLNATLTKNFKVTEHQNLAARLEMQNVTNSVMYDVGSSATTDITNSRFGRMNNASDGVAYWNQRRMQLSLKYTF